jgi:hypothetical protein
MVTVVPRPSVLSIVTVPPDWWAAVHLREAKAATLVDFLRCEERIEYLGQEVRRDARARIADAQRHELALDYGRCIVRSQRHAVVVF